MAKNQKNFFETKRLWSTVKDDLLGCYLAPYFAKMLTSGKPILYVDCFAGKGKFDDGKDGSPLIAIKALENALAHQTRPKSTRDAQMRFIETVNATDLNNLLNQNSANKGRCKVISGKFEDKIIPTLQAAIEHYKGDLSVFLYVDPYGVKVLNAQLFDEVSQAFKSAELLINLNTFGFIREACRVMNFRFDEQEEDSFDGIVESDPVQANSIDELNGVAGGDYWQPIIREYNAGKIDTHIAEKMFAAEYKARLRDSYRYVLGMPIRLKKEQHPKYYMIHATNHEEGCILMADNIAKRTDRLVVDIQENGQMTVESQTAENEFVSAESLRDKMCALLKNYSEFTRLNVILADFYNTYGVLCGVPRLSSGKDSVLKLLEKTGDIIVERSPQITKKGKPSNFWSEDGGKSLSIKGALK